MGMPAHQGQKPFKFPCSYSEFLRYLMPKKRPRKREWLLREYLRHTEFAETTILSEQRLEEALTQWRAIMFDEGTAVALSGGFHNWLTKFTKDIHRVRSRKAATARWRSPKPPAARNRIVLLVEKIITRLLP